MHIDAKVLRVDAGGCGAGEVFGERRSASALSSNAGGLWVSCDTDCVFSFRVPMGDKESDVVDIAGNREACFLRRGGEMTVGVGSLLASCHKYVSDSAIVTEQI